MNSNKPARRRFIAGAVCPDCGAMDRMVVEVDSDERHCIACGFRESRPAPGPAAEPATRVSRAAARRVETPAETVTLLDPAAD